MALAERKPPWLKVPLAGGERHAHLKQLFRSLQLNTVCEEARCPNIGECWREGTATLMLLGDVCTRGCRFCAVSSGNPGGRASTRASPSTSPMRSPRCDLAYVVLTMVDRDDLLDGGAAHVARTVQRIRARSPAHVDRDALVGDFSGDEQRRRDRRAATAAPTCSRTTSRSCRACSARMRDARCSWERSLSVLRMRARARRAT